MEKQNLEQIVLEPTLKGLEEWTNHTLTHFGYMLLAMHKKEESQLLSYEHSISKLKEKLTKRKEETADPDTKVDLYNLLNKVLVVEEKWNHLRHCKEEKPAEKPIEKPIDNSKNEITAIGGAKTKKSKSKTQSKSKKVTKANSKVGSKRNSKSKQKK